MQFRRDLGKAQAHFFSVWKEFSQEGLLPEKAAIGLRELRHFVTYYAVLDRNEGGAVSIIHSGTGFDELWGRNIAGCLISELAPAKALDLLTWFFKSMMRQPCGGHSEEIFTKQTGERYQMDLLYLPVRKKNGAVAVAAMADLKLLGPTDYIQFSNRIEGAGQIIQYADFIDIGYGIPAGYFES